MAKFYDAIGYGEAQEVDPGVYEDVITERKLYGDVLADTRQMREGGQVNQDLAINNSISVNADAYAYQNILKIRYIRWLGAYWNVTNVEVKTPRIILRMGGLYNGPRPTPPSGDL